MQTYTHYKDSGIDWIGQIPEHWETKKMKYLFIDFSKKNMANETLLSVTQNQGVVPREWVENRMVMPSGNLESFKYIEKGDFCISLRSFEGGLEYCFHSGIVSPAYTVLKGIFKHHDGYYKYLFKSQIFINELQLSIVGIREGKNISYELLKYDFLPIPPIQEQEAIAKFLDDKTAKIDALVQTKAQQIEKLKELRQAKIHQAVTKGLDANAPTKDSGIEWIGEIPAHWEIGRFTQNLNFQEGPGIMALDFKEKGIPLIRISGVKTEIVTLDGCNYLDPNKVNQKWVHFKTNVGDLVISGSASTDLISEIKEDTKGSILYTGLIRLFNFSNKLNKIFLKFFIKSEIFKIQIELLKTGSTISHFGPSHLQKIKIVLPPIQEQEQIVTYLDEVTGKIDQAIAQKLEQITKLKEYKQSLINDLVTGKVKVC